MTSPQDDSSADSQTSALGLDPRLLDLLACPCPAHAPVREDAERGLLVCTECGRGFVVNAGIPVMLLDESVPAVG
ncbi:MAG: Trm112 family protein [Candidatus Nanopelagicales bacterium]